MQVDLARFHPCWGNVYMLWITAAFGAQDIALNMTENVVYESSAHVVASQT